VADAGAASALVNTFHQVGTCLGLGIAVVAAAAVPAAGSAAAHLASQVPADLAARRPQKQHASTAPAPQFQKVG